MDLPPGSFACWVGSVGRPATAHELLYPTQPLALQLETGSGSCGPGELLRQLRMLDWLGCGPWMTICAWTQPALDEPPLQGVDKSSLSLSCWWWLWLSACWPGITNGQGLLCRSWLGFVLPELIKMVAKCGNNYWKPTVKSLSVMAELMIQFNEQLCSPLDKKPSLYWWTNITLNVPFAVTCFFQQQNYE